MVPAMDLTLGFAGLRHDAICDSVMAKIITVYGSLRQVANLQSGQEPQQHVCCTEAAKKHF